MFSIAPDAGLRGRLNQRQGITDSISGSNTPKDITDSGQLLNDRMKAMSVGVIFGLIFTIIVMIMLIVFGSTILAFIFPQGNDAQLLRVIENMETVVDDIHFQSSGSGQYFTLNIPKNSKLCFVNSSHPDPTYYPDPKMTWDPDIVYQKMITDGGYNIWYETSSGESGGEIKKLSIAKGKNFCAFSGMKIYLQNVAGRVTIIE